MIGWYPEGIAHAVGVSPVAVSVYGQSSSFTTATANNGGISTTSLDAPRRVVSDSSGNVYVTDTFNNRVLYYPAGTTTATRVYGQAGSFTTGTADMGGISATSLSTPKGLGLDSSGNLYIVDSDNSRVLYYPAGTTTATRVYGQAGSFTTGTANMGGTSATSLNTPIALFLDNSGNLYIVDANNNRVLYYPAGTTTATRVYGQAGSFTTNQANSMFSITANSLSTPTGVAVDSANNVYISDNSNNRVLYYPAGTTTATRVYGQAGFTTGTANMGGISATSLSSPYGVRLDANNNLYIIDTNNNRMLYYPVGTTTATRVYGQAGSFTAYTANTGGISASSLNTPVDLFIGNNDTIYVADDGNNRVLTFQTSLSVSTQPPVNVAAGTSFTLASSLIDVGSGAVFRDFSGSVTVAIQAGTGTTGAVLSGTTTILAVLGVATFATLSINKGGTGYILTASSPGVGSASTNTLTIIGALIFTYLTSPSFTFTLTGATDNITYPSTFKVNDTTQSGLGWHVNITSTQWTTTGGQTLPTTATTITGVSAACTAGQTCVLPTNGISSYPITVPAATTAPDAITYYSANRGTGTGDVTLTTTFALSIAPGTHAGTYSSTITETLVYNAAAIYSINSGGTSAGNFSADNFFSSSTTTTVGSIIDTSGVINPAPQAVYQTQRLGNFTYTIPALVAGAQYTVRLHFAETYWTTSGQRTFNVSLNGVPVLTSFDIFAAAGAKNKAVVKQFTTTANTSGQIVIVYTSILDNSASNGIEIIAN